MMYNAPWPEALKTIYKYVFSFQVDFISFLNPACSEIQLNFYWKFVCLLLFFTVFCAILSRHLWWNRLSQQSGDDEERSSNALRDLFIAVLLFHPGITGMALRFFRCRNVGDDYYLIADLHLKCFDPPWWSMSLLVISVLIVFTFGVPVYLYFFLTTHNHELQTPMVKKMYGAVYSPYREDCYYFECVQLLLKTLMWAALVMFDYQSTVQLAAALALNIFQLYLQGSLKPFGGKERVVINQMQTVQLTLTTVMSLGALSMAYIVKSMESKYASQKNQTEYEKLVRGL